MMVTETHLTRMAMLENEAELSSSGDEWSGESDTDEDGGLGREGRGLVFRSSLLLQHPPLWPSSSW